MKKKKGEKERKEYKGREEERKEDRTEREKRRKNKSYQVRVCYAQKKSIAVRMLQNILWAVQ